MSARRAWQRIMRGLNKMNVKSCLKVGLLAIALAAPICGSYQQEKQNKPAEPPLTAKIRRFAPTEITADASGLSKTDRQALDKIIEAARLMDPIFLRQVWSGNVALLKKLEADTSPEGRERLHYFKINVGPWSRLDENVAFIENVPPVKVPHGSFYPDDMTKDEFSSWAKGLPENERQRAEGFFYVIRRDAGGKIKTVPYSEEYREFLDPAAKLLREAAQLTTNQTLKNFLTKRADAFMSNDYYASDVAWMDLDAPIDVTIGPYETYADEWFNYKAAFEAYVTLRDEAESAKLAKFSQYLQELENNLPLDARHRNPKLGAASPIRVVNQVYSSGEGNSGVQTAAFNLPNDERVIKEKGSKRVMLKNVQEAKFQKVLIPISKVVLDTAQQQSLSFEAFFTHILAHELMHGLGPHNIKVGGKDTTVRQQLKELNSSIEEAKADITGLWALQYLMDKGVIDRQMERSVYTTFLASAFRSVRFGITEAHGRGIALQFNYLVDEGAININEGAGTFSINQSKIKESVRKLAQEILTLQAEGSYEKAKAMLDKYAVVRPPMQKALVRLSDVPVDIEPSFPLAQEKSRSFR
jgi:Peptidase family M49